MYLYLLVVIIYNAFHWDAFFNTEEPKCVLIRGPSLDYPLRKATLYNRNMPTELVCDNSTALHENVEQRVEDNAKRRYKWWKLLFDCELDNHIFSLDTAYVAPKATLIKLRECPETGLKDQVTAGKFWRIAVKDTQLQTKMPL